MRGLIHLLDYKPKARHIDSVNQLVVYALAFASRTRLPVKGFKCAWCDEKDYFEFFPLQAIKAKSAVCERQPARGEGASSRVSGRAARRSPAQRYGLNGRLVLTLTNAPA